MSQVNRASRSRRKGVSAQWIIVIALSAVALGLLVVVTSDVTRAQEEVGVGSGSKVLAVAGKVTGDSYGIYLIDTSKQNMCVYEWLPGDRKLRLMAARNFSFDLQLDEYNTEPLPREIRKLVAQSRRLPDAPPKQQ